MCRLNRCASNGRIHKRQGLLVAGLRCPQSGEVLTLRHRERNAIFVNMKLILKQALSLSSDVWPYCNTKFCYNNNKWNANSHGNLKHFRYHISYWNKIISLWPKSNLNPTLHSREAKYCIIHIRHHDPLIKWKRSLILMCIDFFFL